MTFPDPDVEETPFLNWKPVITSVWSEVSVGQKTKKNETKKTMLAS